MILRLIPLLLGFLIFVVNVKSNNVIDLNKGEKTESTMVVDSEIDTEVEVELEDYYQQDDSLITLSRTVDLIHSPPNQTSSAQNNLTPPPELG